jgi:hypothetical protein
MTIEQWLEDGKSDAYRRQLPALADLLDGLARTTAALRAAEWNDDAEHDNVFASDLPTDLPTDLSADLSTEALSGAKAGAPKGAQVEEPPSA